MIHVEPIKKVKGGTKWALSFYLFTLLPLPAGAQRLLTLDSCRAMALRNNKQLSIAKVKQEVAANLRRSARTKYLPHISAIGTYQYTSEEISILNGDQKFALSNMGTRLVQSDLGLGLMQGAGEALTNVGGLLATMGVPLEQIQGMQQQMQQAMGQRVSALEGKVNGAGQRVVEAFRTDTRNIWGGSVMLTQPVFMGGSIVALNRLADINERMAMNTIDAKEQATIYATDKAYWQVVSLRHKQKLAQAFLDLVKKLDGDVQKMIAEGVATRSDGLSVAVKVNEAEMTHAALSDHRPARERANRAARGGERDGGYRHAGAGA